MHIAAMRFQCLAQMRTTFTQIISLKNFRSSSIVIRPSGILGTTELRCLANDADVSVEGSAFIFTTLEPPIVDGFLRELLMVCRHLLLIHPRRRNDAWMNCAWKDTQNIAEMSFNPG